MEDSFDLPVTYQDKELLFPAELQQLGYTHRFLVSVYGTAVFFEPDEEGSYRAIIHPDELTKQITPALLQAIANGIVEVLK